MTKFLPANAPYKREHLEPIIATRYNVPEDSIQLTVSEYRTWYCIELMNWETGDVLFHADVTKQSPY